MSSPDSMAGKESFMYTGKPYDSATGLYYFGARYLDTSTGRFVTQDSYQGSKRDPMSMNRYIYARENPEKMVDPNGHVFIDENGVLYVASGTALRAAGVITTPPVTTSSAIQASSSASVVVTPQGPPDVVLAQSGNVAASGEDLTFQQQMNDAGVSGTSYYGGVPGSNPRAPGYGTTERGSEPTVGTSNTGSELRNGVPPDVVAASLGAASVAALVAARTVPEVTDALVAGGIISEDTAFAISGAVILGGLGVVIVVLVVIVAYDENSCGNVICS